MVSEIYHSTETKWLEWVPFTIGGVCPLIYQAAHIPEKASGLDCHVQEEKKKEKKKSTEIACYPSLISELQKEQVFPCNSWLHRYYASVHMIRWMQGTLVLPHPTSRHLATARGFMERKRGPRLATRALLSWEKLHQVSCGQLLIPRDWFSKADRMRHNILPNNTDVSSCF